MAVSEQKVSRPYRGVSAAERRKERRQRLIDAGVEAFGDQGYQATTVKTVCNAAGLTERYFYESFANREDFFRSVYEHLVGELLRKIVDTVSAQQTPTDMARLGLRAFFSTLREEPHRARIILVEVTRVGGEVDAVWRKSMADYAEVVRGFIPAFFPSGKAVENDRFLAAGLVGATLNIAMTWMLGDFAQPVDAVVDSAYLHFIALQEHFN